MHEITKAADPIIAEMEQGILEAGGAHKFFNNMRMYFPGIEYPEGTVLGWKEGETYPYGLDLRALTLINGSFDTPYGMRDTAPAGSVQSYESEMKRALTPRQFFAIIDETIADMRTEQGTPMMDEVIRLRRLEQSRRNTLTGAEREQFGNDLLRVERAIYLALRRRGFNHVDITA